MISEKLEEVLKHEGVVSIVTQGNDEPHVVNTWNSYIKLTNDDRILIPVGTMKVTEANIENNNKIQLTLGSKEVQGLVGTGTGFLIKGTAAFIKEGTYFESVKKNFSWARAALEVKIDSVNQTI